MADGVSVELHRSLSSYEYMNYLLSFCPHPHGSDFDGVQQLEAINRTKDNIGLACR